MTPWEWCLLVLAAWQVVDTYFNGSILAWLPEQAQAWRDQPPDATAPWLARRRRALQTWLGELGSCHYCFSHWPPLVLTVLVLTGLPGGRFLLCWLAAVRVITLANLLLPKQARLDRVPELLLNEAYLQQLATGPLDVDDTAPGTPAPASDPPT